MTITPSLYEQWQKPAHELIEAARRNNGLAPLDLDQFWADQAKSIANPFGSDIPQMPFGAQTTHECVYDELGIPEDFWRYENDDAWRVSLNKAYNDKAQAIVGKRLLDETPRDPALAPPKVGTLADVFEAKNIWHGQSWWLQQSADTVDELRALLDRVDACDIRKTILPATWDQDKERILRAGGKLPLYRWQRGPVTFATSIFGTENLLFLIMDEPDLALRLRDSMLRVMLKIGRVLDEESGYTPDTSPRGFGFADDNCALLTPEMYEMFGLPVLQGMFKQYAPQPKDWRFQHSDSAMGHLLPVLAKVDFQGVNFGPNVMADDIRSHMPNAVIHGVLAPFAFSRNEELNMLVQLQRDFYLTRESRGIVFSTAGSVNNGSRLTGMRLMMAATQKLARYEK